MLVSRTAHRSTLSGLILAGLEPVWLPTDIDPRLGLPTGLSLAALEAALAEHPDAAAVFCVEPSYVGTLSDLPAVVALAHAHDVAGGRRPGVGRRTSASTRPTRRTRCRPAPTR